MDHRALNYALETSRRFSFGYIVGNKITEFVVHIVGQAFFEFFNINTASPHHANGIFIVGQ